MVEWRTDDFRSDKLATVAETQPMNRETLFEVLMDHAVERIVCAERVADVQVPRLLLIVADRLARQAMVGEAYLI